jgi:hypothetical protein
MPIDISSVIAEALGIFFVVMGVAMVVNGKETAAVIEEAAQNRGFLWTWGFLALATGAVIVALNNLWTSGLPLAVTILGWLALVKGAFILVFPGAVSALYRKFGHSGLIVFAGVVALVVGFALLYA